jgi:hypothetical protein
MTAQQGHKYSWYGREVLALESSGWRVKVALIDMTQPYPLGAVQFVWSQDLKPLPMKYFHGELPA